MINFNVLNRNTWNHILVVNVLNCNIAVSEFEFQSCYYVHFRTNTLKESYELSYPPLPAMDEIVTQLYFYKDNFGINKPTKVDMLLNKVTKINQTLKPCNRASK